MTNTIFIEYEYETRELPWRSQLALNLRRSFDLIFIGYRDELMNYALTLRLSGVYFAKDLPPERLSKARLLRQLNIRFVLLDEEAFSVFQLPEKLYYYRYAKPVLEFIDGICIGSYIENEILNHNLGVLNSRPKIFKGLSPRYQLDTSIAQYPASPCRSRQKVLFPMSMPIFHAAGHAERRNQIERMLASLRKFVPNRELQDTQNKFLYRYTRMRRLNILLLIYLNRVSEELGLNVIVRTHPTEKFNTFYQWASKNFPLLSFNGPAHPIGYEIVRCDLLVHTNCTSGLESHNFYGRKTICLNQIVTNLPPNKESFLGIYGQNVTNFEELVEAIQTPSGSITSSLETTFFYDRCNIQHMVDFLSSIGEYDDSSEKSLFEVSALFSEFLKNIRLTWLRIKLFFVTKRRELNFDSNFEQVAVGVYRLRE